MQEIHFERSQQSCICQIYDNTQLKTFHILSWIPVVGLFSFYLLFRTNHKCVWSYPTETPALSILRVSPKLTQFIGDRKLTVDSVCCFMKAGVSTILLMFIRPYFSIYGSSHALFSLPLLWITAGNDQHGCQASNDHVTQFFMTSPNVGHLGVQIIYFNWCFWN
jgi:hypothetical protein